MFAATSTPSCTFSLDALPDGVQLSVSYAFPIATAVALPRISDASSGCRPHRCGPEDLSDRGILVRHVLPLALPVLASQIAFQAGGAILAEAGLSFLGLGDPTVMSWGAQLGSAQRFVREAWWMSLFPGVGITVTVLACNVLADAIGSRRAEPA
jgi:ABC-type dipeptide/oligopeptide/nickel transport systems, permease components